ncbi:MAG: threo-3-hydroxy-L-aspartate ammonia-lyase [Longimonas sp.]|uniref:threo-3-hydroxy-L-aspartate ammonia-lyase n=1 Tax=Longimonas sp. TaxID=2039626 RepID=UPI003354CF1E
MPTLDDAVTVADVARAANRLRGVVHRTPVHTSRSLNAQVDADVFLKCENLQRIGAFKIRGGYNALSQLSPEQQAGGVIAYSSGNHAQAVALSGQLLGIDTTILMPENAPTVKLEATRGYGAEVITYDPEQTVREEYGAQLAEERGLTLVPPYDHPHVIAGQGTVGWELLQQVPDLDMLLVCCGGGGMLSGCGIAAAALQPDCTVVGVEPEAGDDATRSFHTGTLHSVQNPDTIADGARTPSLGEYTFPLVRRYADDMVTVPDSVIIDAMRFLWTRTKLVTEPTGALALAALFNGAVPGNGRRIGVTLSGGNVDIARAAELIA